LFLFLFKELEAVPESSILGVGCGAPVKFADIKEGEVVVVDIGSGGGIDVFLSANKVKDSGKVIGIDMTDGMLDRNNAKQNGFRNVEFKKGDIERGIPIEDGGSIRTVCYSNYFMQMGRRTSSRNGTNIHST
jgi:arsenite methyltransferase